MRNGLGVYSAAGVYALLTLFGASGGGLKVLQTELPLFVAGNITAIHVGKGTPLDMLSLAAAAATVALPVVIVTALIIWALLPPIKRGDSINPFNERTQSGLFSNLMQVIIFEEFIARYLFLTLIPKVIDQWRGPDAYMSLFLVGNLIWALLHAYNHHDRHPLRTVPQFVAGFFFGYMYLKYGFTGALIAHFTYDCVLWATDKVQEWNEIEILKIFLNGMLFLITWFSFGSTHVSSLGRWLTAWNPASFAISGWHFWDYVWFHVMISSGFKVVSNLLACDEPGLPAYAKQDNSRDISGCAYVTVLPLILLLFLGIIWVLYAFVGLFTHDMVTRVLWIAILFAFSQTSISLSAMSNVWFTSVPLLFISFCTLEALGWRGYLVFCLVLMVISIPSTILQRLDT